jgi:hypothetical protein
MTKPISRSIFDAYFHVAEGMERDPRMPTSRRYFHRTKKVAFSVMAERLDKDGLLPLEKPYAHTKGKITKWGKR